MKKEKTITAITLIVLLIALIPVWGMTTAYSQTLGGIVGFVMISGIIGATKKLFWD